MKYDGTGWCKQTAAIEEGRHRSGSFTHWCAWRPGTKSLLMKVLAEAQGVRGVRMVSISRANQTAPHHTVPYRARTSLPGTLLFPGVVFHRCLSFLCLSSTQIAESGWIFLLNSSFLVRHHGFKPSGLSDGTGLSQTLALFLRSLSCTFSQEKTDQWTCTVKSISTGVNQLGLSVCKCKNSHLMHLS